MSSDNQQQNPAQKPSQSVSSMTESTDKVYRIATLLIVAIVYMVFISPRMRARAVTEKTAAMKATFRWVDLLTKLILVYLLAYAATCHTMTSIVITLVFLLFATHDRDMVVIEPKSKMVEGMTGDEDELDEPEDIDGKSEVDDFEFSKKNGTIVYESDKPVFFPLDNGSMDPDMADEFGDLYQKPSKVAGLVVDTVAESERLANEQGLGLGIMDEIPNMVEKFESSSGCGCQGNRPKQEMEESEESEEMSKDSSEEMGEELSEETNMESDMTIDDVINKQVEEVAEEVKAEKKKEGENVQIPEKAKDEVRKAVKYVTNRMDKDMKTYSTHDVLMICRMVYGQMFRCKGIMKTVVMDAESK